MSLSRKLRTCIISFILLLSSISFLIIIPENVRAESSGSTTLYFHDIEIEDEELLDLLYFYMDEKLFEKFYEYDLENMTDEELEELLSDWDELFELLFSSGGIIKTMDQTPPTKTNNS